VKKFAICSLVITVALVIMLIAFITQIGAKSFGGL